MLIREARRPTHRGRLPPRPGVVAGGRLGSISSRACASRPSRARSRSPPADAAGARRVERRGRSLGRRVGDEPGGQGVEGAGGRRLAHILSAKAPAKPQDRPAAAKRRGRFDERVGKARMDEIVPAIERPALRRLMAGDDEALSRTGHGDIEQAAMFARLGVSRLGPRCGDRVGVLDRLPGPGQDRRIVRPRRRKPHQLGFVPRIGTAA